MKKLLLIVLGCLTILYCGKQEESSKEKKDVKSKGNTYNIGITQVVTHPSLDLVKEGFKQAFKDAGIEVKFDEKNAEGNIANANMIASGFKSAKLDLVFGISTSSAQALSNNISDIPVLFSAVTDPVSAKILNKNVTGTSDKLENVSDQLDLLLKLKPEVKKIGILYNPSEQNSIIQVKEIQDKAKEKKIEVEVQGVTSFSEILQATKILLEKSDALYLPTDNTVVSAIKLIISEANSAKKPVISSEKSSVEQGALFTLGLDYFEMGKRTGEMAIEILKGKPVSEIPYETPKKTTLYLNENTAKILGIDVKNPVLGNAEIIK